jgi:hypothetical protein
VERMDSEAAGALAEAEDLKDSARLEDLHLWKMEKELDSKKGRKGYEYWMASWRQGSEVHNKYIDPIGHYPGFLISLFSIYQSKCAKSNLFGSTDKQHRCWTYMSCQ